MDNSVTILVNSCDKYEDAWEPFFKLLKIQWPECENYKIVLSTETKAYNCSFLDVKTVNVKGNLSWSSRLKNTLEQIETEYVLFFLEDFFLLEKVRTDIFTKAFELIESDKRIGLITFSKRRYGSTFPDKTDYDKCFIEQPKSVKNRTNVLVGLWRKEYFLKLLYGDENPWEYEKNSNIRSRFAGYKIFTQDYNYSPATFRYCMNPVDGFGITQGKWLHKNKELFESYGINNVDYANLGVFDKVITYEDISADNTKRREEEKKKRQKYLKKASLPIRIKEYLYEKYKIIKKSKIITTFNYWKICLKYFIYYKFK